MSRDKRDAEQAARRARRLAERADERAERKDRQAKRAQERAERLAERIKRRARHEGDLDRSVEDLVDEMTDKAGRWIGAQANRLFSSPEEAREMKRARLDARRARAEADEARSSAARAGKAADDLSSLEHEFDSSRRRRSYADVDLNAHDDGLDDLGMDDLGLDDLGLDDLGLDDLGLDDLGLDDAGFGRRSSRAERRARRTATREARSRKYGAGRESEGGSWHGFDWGDSWYGSRRRARHRKTTHLYHDKQRKKLLGVCAGLADYWGRPPWEIRLYTVLGLFFIPSVTFPAYFILYFLMDEKPYYRRVTDRFDESMAPGKRSKGHRSARQEETDLKNAMNARPKLNNVQAMKAAKDKFADIEQRLRQMESHVTSSRFELQREFRKMAGED